MVRIHPGAFIPKVAVMPTFKDLKITSKLIIWFLSISIIPLSIAIYVSYDNSQKVLKEEIKHSLLAVADNKANQIEAYLQRIKKDAATLSSAEEIVGAVEKFTGAFENNGISSPEYGQVDKEFRPMLTYYQRSFGYDNLMLVSLDGDMLFSVKELKEPVSLYEIALRTKSELSDVFIRAKTGQQLEVSNFEVAPEAAEGFFYIASPIFRIEGVYGVIILQLSNKGLYDFVREYSGLGNTGETILAAKVSNEAVFIAPLRFDPKGALKVRIKMGSGGGQDIQKAVDGREGLAILSDYRGKEVLSVWRYLPSFRLGMVVKMDVQEIFAPAIRLRNSLLQISFFILIAVVIIALNLARSLSRPIMDLTHTSRIIADGELSARANVAGGDEIGKLAATFNQMTDRLVEAKASVERKNAEVEEQKRLLEKANKELDSFVYTVSHDLRAPLRGIDGLAQFIENDYSGKLDNQGQEYVSKIRVSVNRMKQLIDDLLTLSRISRIKNPFENTDMNELVKSALGRIEFDIKQNKAELKIAPDLPVVYCDKIKMEEVFLNLINNAIKFSSKNKDSGPKIEIGYAQIQGAHEFYVKDNGIGIDKKYHDEIFGMFKRLHAQEEYEGTGAGLSIVKRIIDDHKGTIRIDSEPGKGATFYFTIPLQLDEFKDTGRE